MHSARAWRHGSAIPLLTLAQLLLRHATVAGREPRECPRLGAGLQPDGDILHREPLVCPDGGHPHSPCGRTHYDWTVTLLNEDVSGTIHRTGFGTQLWLVDAFLDRRFTLGFGAGLYAFVDFEPQPDSEASRPLDIAGLVTVTTSYRFSDHWFTRFNWNRVTSNDNHDSDIFLLGVGYRWGQ